MVGMNVMIPRLSCHADKAVIRERAEVRGHVAYLMAQDRRYRTFPLEALNAWIETPAALGQVQVFFDPIFHHPIGYVTWAWLAPDVEQRWLTDPEMELHFSEWNEGERLWIMDFVAPYGHAYDMARYLQRTMFAGQEVAFSLRRDDDGQVIKRSRWSRR